MVGGIEEGTEDEALTASLKDSGHIFADVEAAGQDFKVRQLKKIVVAFTSEREELWEIIKEDKKEIIELKRVYEDVLKELANMTSKSELLKIQLKEAKKFLADYEDKLVQQDLELEELRSLKEEIKRKRVVIRDQKAGIETVQKDRNQYRRCIIPIRAGLNSIKKGAKKEELEQFVLRAREALSAIDQSTRTADNS